MLSARFRFRHGEVVRFSRPGQPGSHEQRRLPHVFESARKARWLHTTKRTGLGALDIILARAEIDFRSPLAYGESVEISVGATSPGSSSFVLESDMHEPASGRLVAASRKVLVYFDYAAGKSAPIPTACARSAWPRTRRRGRPGRASTSCRR